MSLEGYSLGKGECCTRGSCGEGGKLQRGCDALTTMHTPTLVLLTGRGVRSENWGLEKVGGNVFVFLFMFTFVPQYQNLV